MNKERTLKTIHYIDKDYDDSSYDSDYHYYSEMVLDEIKLLANRDDIPVEYANIVADLIGYRLLLAKEQVVTDGAFGATNVTSGEIKAITEGDTRTEFTTSADSKIAFSSSSSPAGNLYQENLNKLVLRIRKLVW